MRLSPTMMLGRRTCSGSAAAALADHLLGLELRALVGVAEALADVELVLPEQAARLARDVSSGDIGEPLEPAAALGELDDVARALDVHEPRLLERQVEGHRGGAVDDGRDVLREPVARRLGQAEAGLLDVARDRVQARVRGQPLGRRLVVGGAHERVYAAITTLDEAAQQLHPHEPGGAGQKHRAHQLGLSPGHPNQPRRRPPCRSCLRPTPRAGSPPRAPPGEPRSRPPAGTGPARASSAAGAGCQAT